MGGVGNQANTVYLWDLVLDFGPFSFKAVVGFTDGLDPWGLGLLGRHGFLSAVYLEIDCPNEMFYVTYPLPKS